MAEQAYEKLNKAELIAQLEARDEEAKVRKGTPAYRLTSKNAGYNGPLGPVYFDSGVAHLQVDLEAEAELQKKIANAKKENNLKLLNQLEVELTQTATYIATHLANDFNLGLEKINFDK